MDAMGTGGAQNGRYSLKLMYWGIVTQSEIQLQYMSDYVEENNDEGQAFANTSTNTNTNNTNIDIFYRYQYQN